MSLGGPTGLALDGARHLVVAAEAAHRVWRLTSTAPRLRGAKPAAS